MRVLRLSIGPRLEQLLLFHVCGTELQKRLDLSQLISKFETIFPGDCKNFPDPGDLCTVHYTARVVGSTEILESRCRLTLYMFIKCSIPVEQLARIYRPLIFVDYLLCSTVAREVDLSRSN